MCRTSIRACASLPRSRLDVARRHRMETEEGKYRVVRAMPGLQAQEEPRKLWLRYRRQVAMLLMPCEGSWGYRPLYGDP